MRQGVPVALALGIVVHAFPTRDNQYGQGVADHVQCGTRHVHDAVDTGDERQTFQRNTNAAQSSQQYHEGHARYTGDAFGGDHQGQNQQQLLADRQVDAVELGNKDGGDRLVQGRTVEVERITGRHHEAADGFRCAVGFHLLDHAWQHGFRRRGGVGQHQLILEDAHQLDHREAEQASDQAQHHEGEEGDGDVNQDHQFGQRYQRREAEVGNGHRDQCEHADRGVVHDHVGDLEHAFRYALEHLHQRLAQVRLQARQTETEQHGEEDDRQHFAAGHGREDVRRDQVEDGLDERVFMLHFGGGRLVLRDVHCAQGAHVDAGTRVEQVGQQQADNDGDGGDDFEIDDRLQANPPEFLGVAHAGNADNQGRDDDRDHDHLDQTDKDIACRLQDVADPPSLLGTEVIEQRTNCNP
ncbi:hypothetical protein D3C84_144840 [compost metagenome]